MMNLIEPQPVDAAPRPGQPVDAAKVARVRRALADGSYRVDPDAVAAAMLATDLALPLTD